MSGLRGSQHLKIQLQEIQLATNNFQTCIGKGGFGRVYKGQLCIDGKWTTVAVKRLNEQFGQGLKEFLTEIQLLTGQNHPNLISLLGYCDEGNEKIIVYEYAENGSLDRYLISDGDYTPLTWEERLKICIGAARGLDHLHNHVGKHQTIIHRDIKSANILLDENWVAKISDLGLSKLSFAGLQRSAVVSHPCGTPGYCEPEYFSTAIVKKESDVYSFGMVLFEVLCGRLCIFRHDDGPLLSAPLAKDYYKKKKLIEITDPHIRDEMSLESMKTFSAVAYGCLQDDRESRPTMDLVVKKLTESLKIQVKSESIEELKWYHRLFTANNASGSNAGYGGSKATPKDTLQLGNLVYEDVDVDEISTAESLQYSFATIRAATDNFSNMLGQGGFGPVYKGKLQNGQEIAVKRLSKDSGQGEQEFKNEVLLLARLQHRNLVRLLGFSLEGSVRLLVYKFVQNGSLDKFIFDPLKCASLDCERRYKIIHGVAKGLLYLHEDSRLKIIHRDLKASNVLLDVNMNAKIADFGIARLLTLEETQGNTNHVIGTYGYMAPEYAMHGEFSVKSDVFSFGVLILEIVTGRKYHSFQNGITEEDLLSHAWTSWRDGTISTLIDHTLKDGSNFLRDMIRCIHVGLLCVQEDATDRPTMASVVLMLGSHSFMLALPSEPGFFIHTSTSPEKPLFEEYTSSTNSQEYVEHNVSTDDLYPR